MKRGNLYRLPAPPVLTGEFSNHQSEMQSVSAWLSQLHDIVNQSLQSTQQRLNSIQQTGAKEPPAVTGLTVTGRQGLFYLTWNRMVNVDGFVITQGSDATMQPLQDRFTVPDGHQCTFRVPVGNVAVTAFFQVYAYQGSQYSSPSPAVSATTLTYTTSEAAPSAPPILPLPPKQAPVRSGPNL